MLGRFGGFAVHVLTTVVIVSHNAIDKVVEVGISPPVPLIAGAAAICTTYVVKKIHRNHRNKNNRRRRKQKDEQCQSCAETPTSQPNPVYSSREFERPSSPVGPRPATRNVTLPLSPLAEFANGRICSNSTTPVPATRSLTNQFSNVANVSPVITKNCSPSRDLTVSVQSIVNSIAHESPVSSPPPDNTDHFDDYDFLDGDDNERAHLQKHLKASKALANINNLIDHPPLTLDELVKSRLAERSASAQLSRARKQLGGKENIAAIEVIK